MASAQLRIRRLDLPTPLVAISFPILGCACRYLSGCERRTGTVELEQMQGEDEALARANVVSSATLTVCTMHRQWTP